MASCSVCKKPSTHACGNECGAVYCSSECADTHWTKNYHYAKCGDYLDTLPTEILVHVLSNLSFQDVYDSARISEQFASIINTNAFKRAFAVKHKGEWKQRVFSWFQNRRFHIIRIWLPILLQTRAWDPSSYHDHALREASAHGDAYIVKLLLESGRVDPTVNNNLPVQLASRNGHVQVVELLLNTGVVDPATENNYAIRNASHRGHVNVVKLLLETGQVDPTVNNEFALRVAIQNGHLNVVKLLLKTGQFNPRANNYYQSDISVARSRNYMDVVEFLEQAVTKRLKTN